MIRRCSALLLWVMIGSAQAAEGEGLTLGFLPYLSGEELLLRYTPLADYLSVRLQRQVSLRVASNYQEQIRKSGEDQLDIAFLGGSPYVAVVAEYGPKPLLVRFLFDGSPTFQGVIFVRKQSELHTLEDLAGQRIAFGDVDSTLSSLVPLYMLQQAGIEREDLAAAVHLRNHQNVILGVELGDFAAGAVASELYRDLAGDTLRILAESPQLSTHLFITRADLDPELITALRQALLDLNGGEGWQRRVLEAINPRLTGFATVSDSDYDLHREILGYGQEGP